MNSASEDSLEAYLHTAFSDDFQGSRAFASDSKLYEALQLWMAPLEVDRIEVDSGEHIRALATTSIGLLMRVSLRVAPTPPHEIVELELGPVGRGGGPAAKADTLPDTPPGRVARAFLALYDDGDPRGVPEFETTYRAPVARSKLTVDERIDRFEAMRRTLGELDFHTVLGGDRLNLHFLARSAALDGWVSVNVILDPESDLLDEIRGHTVAAAGSAPSSVH